MKKQGDPSGAALLITMVFIVLMLSFAAIFYERTTNAIARSTAQSAASAANSLLYSFAKSALDELTQTIKKETDALCRLDSDPNNCRETILIESFDYIYKLPIFFDLGGFHVSIACSPQGLKADINSLKIEDNIDETNRDQPVFRRRDAVESYLRDTYHLYSSWQFFELLDFVFDSSGRRNGYLRNDTRLNISNPSLERGRVSSARVLRMIAQDYVVRTHDEAALKIDWDALFDYELPSGKIDFNNMAQESCEMVFSDMPTVCDRSGEERVKREDITTRFSQSEKTIGDFGLIFGFNPNLSCRVTYQNDKARLGFSFYYNSENGQLHGLKIEPR
ncbi:hypothetical protein FACS189487_02410 [Campylobacterota bacterium]|nr:hypothetical protein FACS189487_02410 [Campylobacterota bacterium]